MPKISIDKDLIRELADLLDETGLTEIEIEDDDVRIRVARGGTVVQSVAAPAMPVQAAVPVAEAEPDLRKHPGAVTSPMVGTVYTAPEPGHAPFVRVGDAVTEGQTLLIIEAMKTMNPVAAPKAGVVKQILVDNEQPVEFGEPLMIIE